MLSMYINVLLNNYCYKAILLAKMLLNEIIDKNVYSYWPILILFIVI